MIYIEKLEPVSNKEQFKEFKSTINDIKSDKINNNKEAGIQSSIFLKKNDVDSILNQYVTKPEEINAILSRCREKNIKMSELINFVKHNSNFWKFIFVEKI